MRPGEQGEHSEDSEADGGDNSGPRTPEMRYEPVPSPGGTCKVTAGDRLVPACAAGPGAFHKELELTLVTNIPSFSTSEDAI